MSADSPRRSNRGIPAIVPPQVVSDRSIIDSVAGFINDCTALSTQHIQTDPKDTITWAKFEQCADISDITYGDKNFELDGNIAPPLLLILGYGLGIQVWAIPENGEAIEVLSWRHGNVTALRILPTPISAQVEMTEEAVDNFVDRRPLMAISDGGAQSGAMAIGGAAGQHYCAVNFVSLRTGAQVKTIKFKNNVLDILANRTSIIITFSERIAVFDARTLDDRLSITTCYPSPGINPNPVALGSRWLAYSENKLLHSKRGAGGCDGEGVASYTATVLNAAKSLGKGLRELGEQMAAGLTGSSSGSSLSSKTSSFDSGTGDIRQPGVVTIMDIKYAIKEISPTTGQALSINGSDPIIAHFIAHSEAIVALEFDSSGMLLITADKRGHDFHVFRIQPHLAGSHLSAIHHLYILHRGDTTAKVQNIAFALDSRWVAVSTLRGTTHVFPITPYGGSYSVRTHGSLHVVNKLSRFHRSAGLSCDQRSSSPISHSDSMIFNQVCMPYNNPTLPPFPRPLVILPLAQLRQPTVLNSPPSSATQNLSYQKINSTSNSSGSTSGGRQRLSSLSDDCGKPLSVCAVFAKPRAWLLDPPTAIIGRDNHKIQRKSIDSLFIMAGHGALIQYDLDTKLPSNIAKEKICDDSLIELEVEAKAQWNLGRKDLNNINISNSNNQFVEIQPPLALDNWLMKDRNDFMHIDKQLDDFDDRNERWLSQVEIITHAGPHRRLWMGPQFVFKTYNTPSGSNLSHIDTEAVEIGIGSREVKPGRSSPMNMPLQSSGRSAIPVLIESGSYSSIEQSPKLMDRFKHEYLDSDFTMQHGESRLKEDLADAMRESPSVQHIDSGFTQPYYNKSTATTIRKHLSSQSSSSDNDNKFGSWKSALSSIVPDDYKNDSDSQNEEEEFVNENIDRNKIFFEKIVNPLGTVTTLTRSPNQLELDEQEQQQQKQKNNDCVIHANCDESLFRPVVTIFCNETDKLKMGEKINLENEKPPEPVGIKLIVPVIEKKQQQKNKNIIKKPLDYETVTDIKKPNESSQFLSIEKKQQPKANKKFNNTTIKPDNIKIDKIQDIKKAAKPRKSEEKSTDVKSDSKNNQNIPEKINSDLKYEEETESYEYSRKLENVRDDSKISFEKNYETKIDNDIKEDEGIQQKSSKDEDSESFESLENIDINETEKVSKPAEKLTEVMPTVSTKISKHSNELIETKPPKEPKIQNKEERKSMTVSITDEIIESEGLVFFDDKFTKDSPPAALKNKTILPNDIDPEIKVELVDYPSLKDSLYEEVSTKEEISEPIKVIQTTSKVGAKIKVDESKTKDKKQLKYQDDSSDSCETVTIVLPSNKKNKKKTNQSNDKLNKVMSAVENQKKLCIEDIKEKPNEILNLTHSISPIDFPKLSFDLPPLSPLEPLDDPKMSLIDNPEDDNFSLINFESPSSPSKNNKTIEKKPIDENSKKFTKNNVILALCGSLHYENENMKNIQINETMKNIEDDSGSTDCGKEYHINLEYKNLANDDDTDIVKEKVKIQSHSHHHKRRQKDAKLFSDQSSTSSSSSETEDTSSSNSIKDPNNIKIKLKLNANDDEELRPLIDGSSMTSSVSSVKNLQVVSKKKKNSRKISHEGGSVSDSGTKSLKRDSLTKIIGIKNQTIKTLPLSHHNQSGADSSSEQAATTSEDEQIVVLPTLISPRKKLSLSDNKIAALTDENSSVVVGSLEDYLPNISSSNNLSRETSKNLATNSGNNNSNSNSQQNLKKKSKRKKR